jgi:glycosyltransferase involved in cell wall biosynthesis
MSQKIAILIPCYNEEQTVGKVIDDFKKVLPQADIYVYDNNSTDSTIEVAKKHGAIVRNEYRQGKGNVVRSMFREIDADCYIMVDGDDTNSPFGDAINTISAQKIADLVLNDNVDMVIGRRYEYFTETGDKKFINGVGNKLVTKLIQLFFNTNIQDILTGFRGFSRNFVKTFPVIGGGFTLETELSIHAIFHNLKIEEVNTSYRERPDGSESKITLSDGFKIVWMFINLVFEYKPLPFLGCISAIMFLLGGILGLIPVMEFYQTGIVNKFPTLIVSGFFIIASLLLLQTGLVMHLITKKARQQFEYAFLNCKK